MTSEDVRSELDRQPFRPLRLHLVSGKTIDVTATGQAYMLQNAVMIVPDPRADRYDVVALRNIERLEQME
jgi:hypothetical protein